MVFVKKRAFGVLFGTNRFQKGLRHGSGPREGFVQLVSHRTQPRVGKRPGIVVVVVQVLWLRNHKHNKKKRGGNYTTPVRKERASLGLLPFAEEAVCTGGRDNSNILWLILRCVCKKLGFSCQDAEKSV